MQLNYYLCEMIQIKIVNKSLNNLPTYATVGSAGMDIHAHLSEAIVLKAFERKLIPTGLHIELPQGYEAQLRMRSSWALKRGLILPNAPATIDSDYRGEIQLIVANISEQEQVILPNDRMAQMVIAKYEKVEWIAVDTLTDTNRGEGGFGSTGGQ
jgi:dUTP pyrophosphatase